MAGQLKYSIDEINNLLDIVKENYTAVNFKSKINEITTQLNTLSQTVEKWQETTGSLNDLVEKAADNIANNFSLKDGFLSYGDQRMSVLGPIGPTGQSPKFKITPTFITDNTGSRKISSETSTSEDGTENINFIFTNMQGDPGAEGKAGSIFMPSIDSNDNLSFTKVDASDATNKVSFGNIRGKMGVTIAPVVSEGGVLSWTTINGEDAATHVDALGTVNIRGTQGPEGPTGPSGGPPGPTGPRGAAGQNGEASAVYLQVLCSSQIFVVKVPYYTKEDLDKFNGTDFFKDYKNLMKLLVSEDLSWGTWKKFYSATLTKLLFTTQPDTFTNGSYEISGIIPIETNPEGSSLYEKFAFYFESASIVAYGPDVGFANFDISNIYINNSDRNKIIEDWGS